MFTGVTGFFGSPGNTDMGEKLLNSVASQSLRHLFTRSESIEVSIRCYPSSKLLQGAIDGLQMQGRGLVIRNDFPMEEMSFQTDAVALDFGALLGGKLRLKQPTQAVAQITLSESGINQSFQAKLVTKRLENLTQPALTELSGGHPVSFKEMSVELLPNNQIRLFAITDVGNADLIPIAMRATLVVERRRRILFSDAQFEPDNIPPELCDRAQSFTQALADILNDMVDLDRFNLDGVTLRINRLETQGKNLLFSGYAQIDHFPDT